METHKIQELNERHRERQQQRDLVHAERAQRSDVRENLDYFLQTFGQQASDITSDIAGLSAAENIDSADGETKQSLAIRCDRIAKSVQQLQTYLSASTLFLPDSVVKRNTSTIAELTGQLDAVKARLLPKKKFGFRSAKTAVASAAKPTDVATDSNGSSAASNGAAIVAANVGVAFDWTCKDRHGEEILLEDEQINGKDITMCNLSACLVRIVGHAGSLQLSNVSDCLILCGPVARSVFVVNCVRSRLAFGCQQFRLHTSHDCQIYMHVTCRAIVEDCKAIEVAPNTFTYAGIEVDFAKTALDVDKNNWRDVADFNWLAVDRQSPNWSEMPEEKWEHDWNLRVAEFRDLRLRNVDDAAIE